MTPRFHVPAALAAEVELSLPAGAARHVQVLRLQPGQAIALFNAHDGQWSAEILRMQRQSVQVRIGQRLAPAPSPLPSVTLAVGMPANERMDWLVEKATELGATQIVPLLCERSVLRLQGERAVRKRAHWQAVAVAASEQSGRIDVPAIEPVQPLPAWLRTLGERAVGGRWMLSLPPARPFAQCCPAPPGLFLSGPEGGLSAQEQADAEAAGFERVGLGPRVLRADTAPIAALAALQLRACP